MDAPRRRPSARGPRAPGIGAFRQWGVGGLLFLAAATAGACGKKGPPLPPIVRVPDAVQQMTARRLGGDVFLTLTLPTGNVDGSAPVDLGRVDVYGYTGASSPPPTRFTEVASLVGTLETDDEGGMATTLRDTLTPEELVAGSRLPGASGAVAAPQGAGGPVEDPRRPLKRFYMAVAFSGRGRAGPPGAVVELLLAPPPEPPADVRATYTEKGALLTWQPSGGLIGFLLDLARPPAASPLDDRPTTGVEAAPGGPTRYNVYRETESEPSAEKTGDTPVASAPIPVNAMPIDGFGYSEPLEIDGRRRCYTVTAVRGTGAALLEGVPSAPACIMPLDTFPPAPPAGVSPIAVEGAISLVWEANTEPDLRGYVVLRGEAGDGELVEVNEQVITETRFTDENVRAGVRYVYAVKAVDGQLPQPNVSGESERVEVTAR